MLLLLLLLLGVGGVWTWLSASNLVRSTLSRRMERISAMSCLMGRLGGSRICT